jgi:DNA-binding NarL/FixJ family response regulator
MYIYRNEVAMSGIENVDDVQSTEKTQTKDLPLTERQEVILRMMSEGRTNSAIGRLMGYSESTIKQETMKIFTKLGYNDRDQASQIYLERIARKI